MQRRCHGSSGPRRSCSEEGQQGCLHQTVHRPATVVPEAQHDRHAPIVRAGSTTGLNCGGDPKGVPNEPPEWMSIRGEWCYGWSDSPNDVVVPRHSQPGPSWSEDAQALPHWLSRRLWRRLKSKSLEEEEVDGVQHSGIEQKLKSLNCLSKQSKSQQGQVQRIASTATMILG